MELLAEPIFNIYRDGFNQIEVYWVNCTGHKSYRLSDEFVQRAYEYERCQQACRLLAAM